MIWGGKEEGGKNVRGGGEKRKEERGREGGKTREREEVEVKGWREGGGFPIVYLIYIYNP